MTLYVDSSAFIKRYVDEPESRACSVILERDPEWASAAHTLVEVRRNLSRRLGAPDLTAARARYSEDWARTFVVDLDEPTCTDAAALAERTGIRTLDALHLAAAQQIGGEGVSFLTYDARQGEAARSLGWTVLGA